tara:strand:+ start:887 stop:1135 length:249 start_codon:yes stop_codon:yes gene_type:complete
MSKRDQIMRIIEEQGPADATRIAELLGSTRSSTRKLLIRMTEDGLLETFPNAPFAYTIAYEQTSPTADDASGGEINPTVCTG